MLSSGEKKLLADWQEHVALWTSYLRRLGSFRLPCCAFTMTSENFGQYFCLQVHAIMTPKRPSSKPGMLWNEDGFIRAGSSYSLHKRQPHRACPPSSLQEALMRQRRLLHGAELRHYWDIPKVGLRLATEQHGCCALSRGAKS